MLPACASRQRLPRGQTPSRKWVGHHAGAEEDEGDVDQENMAHAGTALEAKSRSRARASAGVTRDAPAFLRSISSFRSCRRPTASSFRRALLPCTMERGWEGGEKELWKKWEGGVVRRWVSTVGLLRRGGRSSSGSGSGGGLGLDRRLELRKDGGMKGVAAVRSTDRTEFPVC